MTIGGLRGAVAFYLALNVSSEYKHLIITTTISLILFTVIGMGSFTPLFLTWLNKVCPNDKIIVKDEDRKALLEHPDGEATSNMDPRHSIGMISKAADLDQNYFQKYLRKDGWEYYGQSQDVGAQGKDGVHVTYQEMERRVTKNYGDLSPTRKSNLVNQELQNRITDSQKKKENKRALTPPGRKEGDIEQDLRGILKPRTPRKESTFYINYFI